MAANFFARAARSSKQFCNAKNISSARNLNCSRSATANSSLQRKIFQNNKLSVFPVNTQALGNNKFSFPSYPPAVGLLSSVKACGLHTTSLVAAADGETDVGSGVSSSGAAEGDATIDPLSLNMPPGVDSGGCGVVEDIFATQALDAPITTFGLGGYTPVGLIQNCLDFLHLGIGLPWWGSIVIGTVLFRALVFPIMIKGQINSAKLSAIKPELERLQEKLREVSNYQNPMIKAQASMELQQLFQKHDCHPAKALISPLIQLPLFISFFLALRQMSYLPLESMKQGGLLWFTDLTAGDPLYILPVACAATMLLTIETGADTGMTNPQMKGMKNVFRGMCVAMVPLTYTFPTAIFLYWMTSNALSLIQVSVMKVPGVKEYLGIPPPLQTPVDPSIKTGSFMENFRAGFKSAQEAAHVKHTENMKKKKYEESLKNTYQETFEYNPRVKQNNEIFKEAKKTKS